MKGRLTVRAAATGLLAGLLCLGGASTAFANPAPGPHGPPNQTCQDFLALGVSAPGHSASSPGSPFDEAGFGAQPNGGTGGNAYNNAGAPSQYDVACYQQSVH
ncbi:hypothetical protein [Streptomyces sp. NRRL WC-3742]|uniref:hypothetical protein n=1 Tax=Streptomyces sp. NRRL WC-3742 TaxID=1463934 RepID=UPI0004C6C57B|nr:hypothetical protein [Streptomyces sp. NRRL WC-3742]